MIRVLDNKITQNQRENLTALLADNGCITREITDAGRNLIGVIAGP